MMARTYGPTLYRAATECALITGGVILVDVGTAQTVHLRVQHLRLRLVCPPENINKGWAVASGGGPVNMSNTQPANQLKSRTTSRWLLFGGLALLGASAVILVPGAEAEEFWAAALEQEDGHDAELAFTNSGTSSTVVDVYDSTGQIVYSQAVPAASTSRMVLSGAPSSSVLKNDGTYKVDAPAEIEVALWSAPEHDHSDDATSVAKYSSLGKKYYISTHSGFREAFFTIVGTQDNTNVEVEVPCPTLSGQGVPSMSSGTPYTFTLDQYDLLNIKADCDLTGAKVHATSPVAVFNGHLCTFIGNSACDDLKEQAPPLEAAGTEFVACSSVYNGRGGYDEIRVVAVSSGTTTVTSTTGFTGSLTAAGDWLSFDIPGDAYIEASAPVIISQYMGRTDLTDSGDPSQLALRPVTQWQEAAWFWTGANWPENRITIATSAGATASVSGSAVSSWRAVGSSGYQCATQDVVAGTHGASASSPALFTAYGYEEHASYWYDSRINCQYAPSGSPTPTLSTVDSYAPAGGLVSTGAELDWTYPQSSNLCEPETFHIYRQDKDLNGIWGQWYEIATTPSDTTEYNDEDYDYMDVCTEHRYKVRAGNLVASSPFSNVETFIYNPVMWPGGVPPELEPECSNPCYRPGATYDADPLPPESPVTARSWGYIHGCYCPAKMSDDGEQWFSNGADPGELNPKEVLEPCINYETDGDEICFDPLSTDGCPFEQHGFCWNPANTADCRTYSWPKGVPDPIPGTVGGACGAAPDHIC